MYGRTDVPQHWSVHAEFTISHDGINDPNNPPQTHTEQDENEVRMTYSWSSLPNSSDSGWTKKSRNGIPSGDTKQYGFQRGNLVFTSSSPNRPTALNDPNRLGVNIQDSGYNSDLLSPCGSIPRRPSQPYNRRCRSTCSITLSSAFEDQNKQSEGVSQTQCGRTQSLRCQTPTLRCDKKDTYYGCGDPWCYHPNYSEDVLYTVPEASEETPSPKKSPEATRRDACVQTAEMIDKCTSPFLKMDSFNFDQTQQNQDGKDKDKKKKKRSYSSSTRRKTEPIYQRTQSPSSITPDSLEMQKVPRRLTRSPKLRAVSPFVGEKKGSASDSKSSDQNKKPRTVHIDVYCTGTELESSSSSDSSDTDNKISSPHTVFESSQMKIIHKRAGGDLLPRNLMEDKKTADKGGDKDESDVDDGISSAYPSQTSSFSVGCGLTSSLSSVPPSWSAYSMSSCAVPDSYDSVDNTSWKDTVSDFGGLLESRFSIANTESLDFVPRRFSELIRPESRDLLQTPSQSSVQPSDSFEYANSEDRLRIKTMEEKLKAVTKTPHLDRRHLVQQQKLKQYLEKRPLPKWESKPSDSDDSDASEKGWTFVKDDDKKLERDSTVRRASKEDTKKVQPKVDVDPGSLSDSSPNASSMALRQRLSLDPTLRSPFMIVPGVYTDPRFIARKFGPVVTAMKKPGHHIGPAKNPDCLCDHCQGYFANTSCRNRTRSVGDEPITPFFNWREMKRPARSLPKETKLIKPQ